VIDCFYLHADWCHKIEMGDFQEKCPFYHNQRICKDFKEVKKDILCCNKCGTQQMYGLGVRGASCDMCLEGTYELKNDG